MASFQHSAAPSPVGVGAPATVRDASFDVLRAHGLTTAFSNPGSTEVALLGDLPADIDFVLGLHEGSVVGLATGWALARDAPALVILHTTAGLGNAVGALATARATRAPLVVLVGQQDRRHLASEPFLAGRLAGLAGEEPVLVEQPERAQDVPGAIARAAHAAALERGPALVIVPMDDWGAAAADPALDPAAGHVAVGARASEAQVAELAALVEAAEAPVLVSGAGSDSAEAWAALVALADHLGCPVHQEPFGARAGFPQDHPRFAGALPAERSRLRAALAGHDLVLAVGCAAFRQYPYADGPLVEPGTTIAVVTADAAQARRSPAVLALLAEPAATVEALVQHVRARAADPPRARTAEAAPPAPAAGEALRAGHVLAALAERLPPEAVVVEETPSSRQELERRLPARRPLGFLSAAMGGLGFALPAAIGVRMAAPDRPVVAVLGDGSSMYSVQALWTAAQRDVGVLVVVLANGGYAIMDRLAEQQGSVPPWPGFGALDVAAVAAGLGCPATRVRTHADLLAVLDAAVPELAGRRSPLLIEVAVAADPTFAP